MGGFTQILSRDLRDLARAKAFRVIAALLAALAVAFATGAYLLAAAPMLVGTMLYFATLLPFLVLLWLFAGVILAKEKASGHLETLLATPLSARSLWFAKSSAIILPGLGFAALSTVLILAASLVARGAGQGAVPFALSAPLLIACALGNPLLLSGLGALTVILAMRASPDAAIIPSFAIGFVLMTAVPAGAATGLVDLGSWAFALAYAAIGILEWLLVLALCRGMTKERIVLSSREE